MDIGKVEEIKKKLMNEVKNEKIQDVEINKKGNVVFKTKWFRYECILKEKNGNISFKLNESGNPAIMIAAIVGFVILVPLLIALILYMIDIPVKKDIKNQIANILK